MTLEENAVIGGFGALVAVRYAQLGRTVRLLPVGLDDAFVPHGSCAQLLHRCRLDVDGLCGRIKDFIG